MFFQRLIETASWGDDPAAIEQQLNSHQKFHSSIQRSPEVDRARDDLVGSAGPGRTPWGRMGADIIITAYRQKNEEFAAVIRSPIILSIALFVIV